MTIGNGILLSGVSILVALTVAPASAQVASTVSDVATPPNAASDDGSVGDIVVTAHPREQRLQDVPIQNIAITSALADEAGVQGTRTEEPQSELPSRTHNSYAVLSSKKKKDRLK